MTDILHIHTYICIYVLWFHDFTITLKLFVDDVKLYLETGSRKHTVRVHMLYMWRIYRRVIGSCLIYTMFPKTKLLWLAIISKYINQC